MTVKLWDEVFDVVVVGAGAAGMAAALKANMEGLSVLVLEKAPYVGGSTAISGGAVWAPLNTQSDAAGHPDSFEKVWRYMRQTVGDAAPEFMQKAFLMHAPMMVADFEKHTDVVLTSRSYSPDYFSDKDGAAMGGRSLDPVLFDGRSLGKHFKQLRDPLPEFMVLGGMMVTMTDAKHLLAVTTSWKSCLAGIKLVARYAADRLSGYHRGTRLVLGNALAARLFKSMLNRRIPYWLSAPLNKLTLEDNSITGVEVQHAGVIWQVRARRGVVIATGGFPAHDLLRQQHYPKPTGQWSMSPRDNMGEGIQAALAGGAVWGKGHVNPAFWAPVSILHRANGKEVRYPHLVWDRAKPGLMAVNTAGQRFVNESTSYHEFVNGMYRSHQSVPTVPAYLICDHRFLLQWGLGLVLPGGRPYQHLIKQGYLYQGNSLSELALQMGIDPQGLKTSAERFNQWAELGHDGDFGKGSTAYNRYLGDGAHQPNACLGPLVKAPFFGVKVYAGDIGTALGIACNENAQALNADGQVVKGLYVAGNDMHSVMGGQYPAPGITLGPAMTFGWLAARHMAQQTVTDKGN